MSQVKMNPKGKLNEIDQNTLLINQPFSLYLEKFIAGKKISLDKKLYCTLSLTTAIYKRVPETYCWG